jgi:hypothetical protein
LLGTFGLSPKPCGAGGLADINSLASRKWKFSSPWDKKVGVVLQPEKKTSANEAAAIPSSCQNEVKKHFKAKR